MIVDDLFESPQTCPECGGPAFSDLLLAEKKDACYNKVRSRYKVWPSAYASGALVQCRKKGAANWGNKSEGVAEAGNKPLEKSRFGMGDTRTPRDIKSQMSGASDEFVRSTADKTTGPFHSKVAKMQGKMAKSELRRREQGVGEGYQFKGPFPFDVDHMHGGRGINLPKAETKKYFTDKKQWQRAVDDINSSKYDDNSDYIGVTGRSTVEINGREWARWSDAQQKGYIELSSMSEQGMAEEQLDEKCWDTHRQVGMKNKGGRMVPNCVPKEGIEEADKIGHMDADKFDDAMARLKKLAGSGPMKTVYDPTTRRYKNVPVAQQPGDKK